MPIVDRSATTHRGEVNVNSTGTPRTTRTRARRLPERARYDRETVDAILDEGLIAHVGIIDGGAPFVIPMSYGRMGDELVLHGATSSRLLRALASGAPVCVTVTLLDGLVVARSAFHSSMNYRSVVVLGTANEIVDPAEKRAALDALTDHLLPGRRNDARPIDERELAATTVIRITIEEASAKLRSGPPAGEPAADVALDTWAGTLPLALTAATPVPAPDLANGIDPPDYLGDYHRPGAPIRLLQRSSGHRGTREEK